MYDTSGNHSVCDTAPPDNDIYVRLAWLKGEVVRAENYKALARARTEWDRMLSMTRPVPPEQAYAKFGLCLGLFPPLAIFARILTGWETRGDALIIWAMLFLLMSAVCTVTGWLFARYQGRRAGDPRANDWSEHVGNAFGRAMLWALVTGGLGGAVGLILGAVVGVFFAMPVALATFPVFAVLHRILSHGGMIEERDLRTIAYGIPLTAAALIMSVGR